MHLASRLAFLKEPPGMTYIPFVLIQLQFYQFQVSLLAEINLHPFIILMTDLINTAQGLVVNIRIGIMALVLIVPVMNEYRSAGSDLEIPDRQSAVQGTCCSIRLDLVCR